MKFASDKTHIKQIILHFIIKKDMEPVLKATGQQIEK